MKKNLPHDSARVEPIGFEDFRAMAKNAALSQYAKIDFPDAYRADKAKPIFEDIATKLPALHREGSMVLDIGCGCSELPRYLIERARQKSQRIVMIDSNEMLAHLPDAAHLQKIAARYPDCPALFQDYAGKFDAILTYSVLQYIFAEGNVFEFLDRSLKLLAPQGRMLIGDIPNISMRKRFFASGTGAKHHRDFTGTDEEPAVAFNRLEEKMIDDSVVMALLARARLAGFHAYVVPQGADLPMANRREDILIVRP